MYFLQSIYCWDLDLTDFFFVVDSIINFGENLPEKELTNAVRESKEADLSIVMGTSMRVRPACELPTYGKKNGGKMVIVNLQKTPCK